MKEGGKFRLQLVWGFLRLGIPSWGDIGLYGGYIWFRV